MSKGVEMTKIDSDKLRRELDNRGIAFSDLSVKLRKGEGYISHCIQRGVMGSGTYDLMCLRLGVDEDYFLKPIEKVNTDDVAVAIDYQTLKHLLACEYAVETILKNTKLSTGYDGTLFIDYKVIYGILKAYVPDDTSRRLEELKLLREEGKNE